MTRTSSLVCLIPLLLNRSKVSSISKIQRSSAVIYIVYVTETSVTQLRKLKLQVSLVLGDFLALSNNPWFNSTKEIKCFDFENVKQRTER